MSTAAVVLAAGASERMGRPKQMLPWRNTTVLGAVVDSLRAAAVDEIVVVLGCRAEEIRRSLRPVLAGGPVSAGPVVTIVNPDWGSGMLSSVQIGLRALKTGPAAVAVALGDQPGMTPSILAQLFSEQRKSPGSIVVPNVTTRAGARERWGHPVVFDAGYVAEILALSQEATLREVRERHRDRVVLVACAEEALLDLDTPEEYAQALKSVGVRDPS